MDENRSVGTLALVALLVGFLQKLGENLADLLAEYLSSGEEDESESQGGGAGGLHVHIHPHITVEPDSV